MPRPKNNLQTSTPEDQTLTPAESPDDPPAARKKTLPNPANAGPRTSPETSATPGPPAVLEPRAWRRLSACRVETLLDARPSTTTLTLRQERAIVALLACFSIAESARQAGVSERSTYDWLTNPDFRGVTPTTNATHPEPSRTAASLPLPRSPQTRHHSSSIMWNGSRRQFLARAAGGVSAAAAGFNAQPSPGQVPGQRPTRDPGVEVIGPRGRAPVSFMIDDSTCLVNLNRFAIPQFGAAWRHAGYHEDWRSMPYEIPDDFVRKFSDWAGGQGVKGKYSVIPYPACVGRLDLEVPGWTREQVDASIKLVRERMMPGWDIHPEMVTHTRVIDTKTGQPYPSHTLDFMENWQWTDGRSVDEIANYMAYALRILRNIDLRCEGITTPGDFGLQALPELAQATLESCRDVFNVEIPHYFRHGFSSGPESVAPRVEYAGRLETPDPRCVVSIIACSGDWTGGWDCTPPAEADPFITADLQAGRMVEIIDRGEPAVMYGHWTGIYYNGQELGFKVMQEVVRRLHAKYDHLIWMKLSELSRYWAAKELTSIARQGEKITFHAPFACPGFTLRLAAGGNAPPPRFVIDNEPHPLAEARGALALESGQWLRTADQLTICFDLPKGESGLEIPAA